MGMVILFAVLGSQSFRCSIILPLENIPSNYESAFLQALSQTKQIKTHHTMLQFIIAKSPLLISGVPQPMWSSAWRATSGHGEVCGSNLGQLLRICVTCRIRCIEYITLGWNDQMWDWKSTWFKSGATYENLCSRSWFSRYLSFGWNDIAQIKGSLLKD